MKILELVVASGVGVRINKQTFQNLYVQAIQMSTVFLMS